MSTTSKTAFWQRHIDTWQSSGLTQRHYCQAHDLTPYTFGYWKKKLLGSLDSSNDPLSSAQLIPVAMYEASTPSLNISFPNGIRMELASLEAKELSRLIGMLKVLP